MEICGILPMAVELVSEGTGLPGNDVCLSGPTDWILRYIKPDIYLFYSKGAINEHVKSRNPISIVDLL